ncbi:MAG: DUF342 domain-containing protein, partial [Planctomycetes bacterium]|nr:DUF342 domain-containing protein [Planctomycetota bacterium]
RPGEGVTTDSEQKVFKAAVEGRPIFYAGTLSVSPSYEVPGDVDFNTGNIKFNGHVIVKGNVLDDFNVECRSIEVQGVVGASKIKCEGPITLRGGVNGRDRAEIETKKGSAHIKYVNQAKVIANEAINVDREVVNAILWCRGRIKAEKIIGGECLALGGVEASILGSELGVSTIIEPGADYEVRKIDNFLSDLGDQIEKILRPVQTFLGDKARFKSLPDEKKEEYKKLLEAFLTAKEKYVKLSELRQATLANESSQPVKEVIVRKTVFQDVFVRTDLCMKQFKKQLTGPVALIEDVDSSTIRPARYVPGKGVVDDEEAES